MFDQFLGEHTRGRYNVQPVWLLYRGETSRVRMSVNHRFHPNDGIGL